MYKAVVFDLFGTLIDLSDIDKKKERLKNKLTLNKFDLFYLHFKKWHRNNNSEETFINTLTANEEFDKNDIKAIKEYITLDKLDFFPDVPVTLKKLKARGIKIYLLTNSPPNAKIEFYNKKLNAYFDSDFWSCDIGFLKPEPEIFNYFLKHISEKKDEILMVGDSIKQDILGAEKCGIKAILIDREYKSNISNRITKLGNLLDLFKL